MTTNPLIEAKKIAKRPFTFSDILTWPVVGPFLRWRHARRTMQIIILFFVAFIVFDGLVGPQQAPKNLATVSAWVHYRGLVVLALLVAGNLFCMACPFMFPREIGRWLGFYLGLFGGLAAGFQIALHHYKKRNVALRAFAPWGVLMVLMLAAALWILFQPMEMRGTIFAGL